MPSPILSLQSIETARPVRSAPKGDHARRSLRTTVGSLAVVLITLAGGNAHAQFDFSVAADFTWNEQDAVEGENGGDSLANLNSLVDTALTDATDTTLCYVLSGKPTNALMFASGAASCTVELEPARSETQPAREISGKRSLSPNWIALRSGAHVDYELGAEQLLTITGYEADGEVQDTLEINLVITDYNERPIRIQGTVETRYWRPGDSERILISDLFKDPDGVPVQFDLSDTSTDVWICDTANPGDSSAIFWGPLVADRDQGPGTPVTFTGGTNAVENCSVSNNADPTASPAPDPNPGVRGSRGNRVLTTRKIGPTLEITADSLVEDPDGDGTVTDRGAGTYVATVHVRVWSGPSDPPLSSLAWASFPYLVKVGANNPPQFAGGAIGFAVTLTEGTDETDPMPALSANDLDSGGNTIDVLRYGLGTIDSASTSVAGGSISLRLTRGDNPATAATETDYVVSIALLGSGLDYEKQTSFTIDLLVTDDWSPPVSVPIHVTLLEVNELTLLKPIEDQNLANGVSMTIDLTEHFEDPEKDEITYEAYTNQYNDVVEVDNDAETLTIHGKHATQGDEGESLVTVTLLARDSKGLEATPVQFEVTTRYANIQPSIDLVENDTIAISLSVFEADSADTILMPLIAYTDDEPVPTPIFDGAPHFKALVDPFLREGVLCSEGSEDCEEQIGKIAIVVGSQDLNHETTPLHTLSLRLQDSWQPELKSKALEIQVSVFDSNDAPTVVPGMPIPTQSIVINGSGSYNAVKHFTDEDGDRLLVDAVSHAEEIATVSVSDLATVEFVGVGEGEARITLTATDPEGESIDLSFTVRVGPNKRPTANLEAINKQLPDDNTVNVGGFVDIVDLKTLFDEKDGGDMVASVTASSSNTDVLLVIPAQNGDAVTLAGRTGGKATLTFTAMDQAGNTTSVDFEISVNVKPVEVKAIVPQELDRVDPHLVDLSELFSDSDDEANSLTITAELIGDHMDRVTVEVTGTDLTITGVRGIEPGDATIKLTAEDPHGLTATSTFVARVVNVPPNVKTSIDEQREFDRLEPLPVDVSQVFADADGEIVMITASPSSIEDERIVEVGDIDLEDGLLEVTALAVGEAKITLEATDNDDGVKTHTFTVTVKNVNPVVAKAIKDQTTTRIAKPILTLDISETFSDPDTMPDTDSSLTFSAKIDDEKIASVTVNDNDSTLMIEGLYVGTATITLTAKDVDGGSFSHDFTIEVQNVVPELAMDVKNYSFDRRAPIPIDLSGTFEDDDGLIDFIDVMVVDDSVVEAEVDDSLLTLTALAVGRTRVMLTATDDNSSSITTEFVVTVVNIDPIVAAKIPDQTTTRVDTLVIDVRRTFHDPDASNNLLTIDIGDVDDDSLISATLNASYLKISGLSVGKASVTLTATDADEGTVSDTFVVTIENVDPVVALAVPDQEMDRRAPLSLDLSETFSDLDDVAPTIAPSLSVKGVVSMSTPPIDDNQILTLTAVSVGETNITLTAMDENGATVSDEFHVSVINIPPILVNYVSNQVMTRNVERTLDISEVFSDPDSEDGTLSMNVEIADDTIAEVTINDSILTIRGLAVGSTTVTLSASDADSGRIEHSFYVTVENVEPKAVASLSPIQLEVGGQPATQTIAGLFIDDGDPLSYTIASGNTSVASVSLTDMTAMIGAISRGSTTFTVTATDSYGGTASVSGLVTVGDNELKAVAVKSLAGFGRAMLASVSSSVGSRVLKNARSSDLTLDTWAPVESQGATAFGIFAENQKDAAWNLVNTTTSPIANDATSDFYGGQFTGMDALRSQFGSNFALNLGRSDKPSRWSIWGWTDRQSYQGAGYDGMVSSVYLGADVAVAESLLLGVSVSNNTGESDYSWGSASQAMDLSLDSVLAYISYQPSDKTSLWGVAGFGSGEVDTTVVGATNDVSDLSSELTMIGGSHDLTRVGRFKLALRGDAAMASLETDEGRGAADALSADVNRYRLGLEGSLQTETSLGGMLEPFGQVSLRSDGGDGDPGTGIEVVGGVRMTSNKLSLEVQGRTLALHGADEYSESGFSMMATLNPSSDATGVSVSITPRWGADAMSNGMLWRDSMNPYQTYGQFGGSRTDSANASIDALIGYGLMVANERFLVTPFVDVRVSDIDRREVLFGASLRQLTRGHANLDVNMAIGRVEEQNGVGSGKIGLNANLRF